jgi:hypothetical protein
MVKQVKDNGGNVVPLLSYKLNGAKIVTYTNSAANSVLVSSKIISATPSTNCFIEIGGTATANSHFLLGGVPYDFSIGAERTSANISVIGESAGTLYISERD